MKKQSTYILNAQLPLYITILISQLTFEQKQKNTFSSFVNQLRFSVAPLHTTELNPAPDASSKTTSCTFCYFHSPVALNGKTEKIK